MKWLKRLLRLSIALFIAFHMQLFNMLDNNTVYVFAAGEDATVTVTARGDIGLEPPSGLIVTRVTDTEVSVVWTPGTANTTIRVKYDAIPGSAEDGYILYSGSGNNTTDTFLNLDVMWSKQYYIAYATGPNGELSDYIYEYVENPNVEEIASSLSDFSNYMNNFTGYVGLFSTATAGFIYLFALIGISILAFWKENPILFLLAFGLAWLTGLNVPDILNGNYETTTLGLTLGLMIIGYSMFCAVMAFRLMFWESKE